MLENKQSVWKSTSHSGQFIHQTNLFFRAIEIEPSHQAAVSQLEIKKNPPTNCVFLSNNKLQDENCDNGSPLQVCTIGYGTVGLGASIGMFGNILTTIWQCGTGHFISLTRFSVLYAMWFQICCHIQMIKSITQHNAL